MHFSANKKNILFLHMNAYTFTNTIFLLEHTFQYAAGNKIVLPKEARSASTMDNRQLQFLYDGNFVLSSQYFVHLLTRILFSTTQHTHNVIKLPYTYYMYGNITCKYELRVAYTCVPCPSGSMFFYFFCMDNVMNVCIYLFCACM